MLSEKEQVLQKLLGNVETERNELLSKNAANYFESELKGTQLLAKDEEVAEVSEIVEEKNPSNYEVLTMIKTARDALISNNVMGAKNIYYKLNNAYKKLPQTDEKKRLYYEIMELKTDIELNMV